MRRRRSQGAVSPFIAAAQACLDRYWAEVQDQSQDYITDDVLVQDIRSLLRARTGSYRYVLPTQLLAKVTDPDLDSRCLQANRSGGTGSFDARTLAHRVIVPFDRKEGKPLGGMPSPYVNNPLRVAEVSPSYAEGQLIKAECAKLCEILAQVESKGDTAFTADLLRQALLEIRRIQQETRLQYPVPQRISLEGATSLLSEFLAPRTGGSRLQAVVVALMRTIRQKWGVFDGVTSGPINAPDAPTARAADVECDKGGKIILAVEVKDRTLTSELLEDKITSCRLAGVTELVFLIRADPLLDDDALRRRARSEFASGLNISFFSADDFVRQQLALVGEEGRKAFLEQVGAVLEDFNLDFPHRKAWSDLLSRSWD